MLVRYISNVTYCVLTYCVQVHIMYDEVNFMVAVKVFAYNLKKYRNKIGISQEDFAERAGRHRTYISAVECGKRSIALDNVQKIADALGIEVYLLFINDELDTKNTKKEEI